jgi:2-polyprenyl-3-methyl-5-hydroxy-6-metoxy-1,4-benzoquinol methylase
MHDPTRGSNFCIWCGAPGFFRVKENDIPIAKYNERILCFRYCSKCKTKQADLSQLPPIDYDAIQNAHRGYAWHIADNLWIKSILSHGDEAYWTHLAIQHLCRKTMDTRYVYALNQALLSAQQNIKLRILEIGCNLGYIGAVMLRLGHDYTGIDVQIKAVEEANKNYGNHFFQSTIESYAEVAQNKFDLILSLDVIEHSPEPQKFLNRSLSLLKETGKLILTTPDGDQMAACDWNTDLPPIHTVLLGRHSFLHMLSKSYQVRFIKDIQPMLTITGLLRRLRLHRLKFPGKISKKDFKSIEALPQLDPASPQFHYLPNRNTKCDPMSRQSLPTVLLYHAIGLAASMIGIRPVGYTLIVEISSKKQRNRSGN